MRLALVFALILSASLQAQQVRKRTIIVEEIDNPPPVVVEERVYVRTIPISPLASRVRIIESAPAVRVVPAQVEVRYGLFGRIRSVRYR